MNPAPASCSKLIVSSNRVASRQRANVGTSHNNRRGFSCYASLPLQAAFTAQLLHGSHFAKGPSKRLVEYLCPFVSDTFHPQEEHDPDRWPDLEDLFTCIDLSANSGRHLGNKHSPAVLRTVRRALIARTIRMFSQAYDAKRRSPTRTGAPWKHCSRTSSRARMRSSA